MPQFLYTVAEVFDFGGHYLTSLPGIPPEIAGINKGVPLQLRRPDGTTLTTRIEHIAIVDPHHPKRRIQFGFPPGLTKADLPVGTEVWLLDEATPTA